MAPRLKLFRTPIGFHDVYVAAVSQKAALAAWGADADLFARGIAERVEDASIMEDAAAQPGVVIRRSRGTAEEHLAVAGKSKPEAKSSGAASAQMKRPRKLKALPRPSRDALQQAERRLVDQQKDVSARIGALEAERARLAASITECRLAGQREAKALQAEVERAKKNYEAAMARWRAQG